MELGVIEGFYGKSWSWAQRKTMVQFLAKNQYSSYWYAPKSDRKLRNDWQEDWPNEEFSELLALSDICKQENITFGIGLSPLALHEQWNGNSSSEKNRDVLKRRLEQIAALEPHGVAVLFDDMQGDIAGLAQLQCDITHFVKEQLDVNQLLMCPSYYSFDPILEELFGTIPDNYWEEIGRNLDQTVDIFWTGDKVISDSYPGEGLQRISELLQRKVVLWDNSIANDGRKTSPFIPIKALYKQVEMELCCKQRIINPMNQSVLAQIPLVSLRQFGDEQIRLEKALEALNANSLIEDLELFAVKGRSLLTGADINYLRAKYGAKGDAYSQDIIGWLAGEYIFDPACLT